MQKNIKENLKYLEINKDWYEPKIENTEMKNLVN